MRDKLRDRFENEGIKDAFEPSSAHRERFLERLDQGMNHKPEGFQLNISYKFMRIAATAAILITAISFAWFWDQSQVQTPLNKPMTLADVSDKYQKVEFFYQEQMIARLAQIEAEDNETEKIVYKEALSKINKLDLDYAKLEADLTQNPGNTRIVFAMIKNYQLRITVLETLLQKLNIQETHKTEENEKADLHPIFPVGFHLVPHTA